MSEHNWKDTIGQRVMSEAKKTPFWKMARDLEEMLYSAYICKTLEYPNTIGLFLYPSGEKNDASCTPDSMRKRLYDIVHELERIAILKVTSYD